MKSFSLLKYLLILPATVISFLLLSVAFSVISLQFEEPKSYLPLFSGIILAATAFIGGFLGSRVSSPMRALIFSVLFIILYISLTLLVFDGKISLLKLTIIIISSVVGAIIPKKDKNKALSRTRRKNVLKRYSSYN